MTGHLVLPEGWRLDERNPSYSYDLHRADGVVANISRGFRGWTGILLLENAAADWTWTAPTLDGVVRQVLRHLRAVEGPAELLDAETAYDLAALYAAQADEQQARAEKAEAALGRAAALDDRDPSHPQWRAQVKAVREELRAHHGLRTGAGKTDAYAIRELRRLRERVAELEALDGCAADAPCKQAEDYAREQSENLEQETASAVDYAARLKAANGAYVELSRELDARVDYLTDELVDAWHEGHRTSEPLSAVLRMSAEEYAAWVERRPERPEDASKPPVRLEPAGAVADEPSCVCRQPGANPGEHRPVPVTPGQRYVMTAYVSPAAEIAPVEVAQAASRLRSDIEYAPSESSAETDLRVVLDWVIARSTSGVDAAPEPAP